MVLKRLEAESPISKMIRFIRKPKEIPYERESDRHYRKKTTNKAAIGEDPTSASSYSLSRK